jgi:hypothetical protein
MATITAMTVKDLKEALTDVPDDWQVVTWIKPNYYPVERVSSLRPNRAQLPIFKPQATRDGMMWTRDVKAEAVDLPKNLLVLALGEEIQQLHIP